jgi:hypothetical protein
MAERSQQPVVATRRDKPSPTAPRDIFEEDALDRIAATEFENLLG